MFTSFEEGLTGYYIGIYVMVFLFGIAIGSFLNVCIYRLPTGESLIKKIRTVCHAARLLNGTTLSPFSAGCF